MEQAPLSHPVFLVWNLHQMRRCAFSTWSCEPWTQLVCVFVCCLFPERIPCCYWWILVHVTLPRLLLYPVTHPHPRAFLYDFVLHNRQRTTLASMLRSESICCGSLRIAWTSRSQCRPVRAAHPPQHPMISVFWGEDVEGRGGSGRELPPVECVKATAMVSTHPTFCRRRQGGVQGLDAQL